MNKIPRIMIAAPKSGSGKTLITCAFLSALKNRGINVKSIKSGPDYIDPMFHRSVLDIESDNLDTFFSSEDECRALYEDVTKGHEFIVFEGVMGLFDGIGGVLPEGSSYHLAMTCNIPIILVVDTKGSARSVIPVIRGFLDYDKSHLIKGIILNNMSNSLYTTMKEILEAEISVPVLGCFSKNESLSIESRHLGLKLPAEIEGIKETLNLAGDILEKSIDIDKILKISKSFLQEKSPESMSFLESIEPIVDMSAPLKKSPIIAVAMDEAFCFYYEINLRILKRLGARVVFFSPLHDDSLPEGTSGIILGGGYPELYAKELSENTSMITSIREAVYEGIPSIAECGGFMYLHETLRDKNQNSYRLIGLIKGSVSYVGRPVRFGYASFYEKSDYFLCGEKGIKGHEFHYYDSDNNGDCCVAKKPNSSRSWECNLVDEGKWWGFSHLYYPSNPQFAISFVKKCISANPKTPYDSHS